LHLLVAAEEPDRTLNPFKEWRVVFNAWTGFIPVMEIPKSTVRFAHVFEACGRPKAVTLWTSPEKQPGFQSAVTENRVMTVIQEVATAKKDYGLIGFHQEPGASFWIFPKPLVAFEGWVSITERLSSRRL
jgi:hypothetical protein